MIRISNIKMPFTHTGGQLTARIAAALCVKKEQILSLRIIKKSTDARRKPDIYYIYTIDVQLPDGMEKAALRKPHCKGKADIQIGPADEKTYCFPTDNLPLFQTISENRRPVVIGSGPAGLFCAYFLTKCGLRPIVLERGKPVEQRKKDVEQFWKTGVLHPDSNVQFGEGGAGTFSDGKLNTLIKDKTGRGKEVLGIFVQAGAPEEILYEAKPHIGTDVLLTVIQNIRNEIIKGGGEIRFESKVTDITVHHDHIKEVIINGKERLMADTVVLAAGHSARDTFSMLYERRVPIEAKSFAVGLRVEHPRKMINRIQYGMEESPYLKAADYKLTEQTTGGRGVYTFCMCPGGYVVNASSEDGRLAVNGMSYHGRAGDNSNSAVIVTVTPDDFESSHPLAGIAFQRKLESKAYEIGAGKIPVETYGQFKHAISGQPETRSALLQEYPDFLPSIKGSSSFAAVHEILPMALSRAFVEGMEQFGRILPCFSDSAVYVSGVEIRTSSPVKIRRDETGQSALRGLYPCGEGAGYAGGITSAAMDGILIAEKIAERMKNNV